MDGRAQSPKRRVSTRMQPAAAAYSNRNISTRYASTHARVPTGHSPQCSFLRLLRHLLHVLLLRRETQDGVVGLRAHTHGHT